jgi:hypothetical protein
MERRTERIIRTALISVSSKAACHASSSKSSKFPESGPPASSTFGHLCLSFIGQQCDSVKNIGFRAAADRNQRAFACQLAGNAETQPFTLCRHHGGVSM